MKSILPLLTLVSMSVSSTFALPGTPEILPLWEGTPPNHQDSDLEETIFRRGEFQRIATVQDPTIEVRLPSPRSSTGQAVVICPGGGYGVLAYDWEGTDTANYLNAHGIAAIVLKYRLPEDASNIVPHESPLIDAKRAMRLTRFHAKDWHIDPDRIGIMGFSAGGHLASTLGTHFDKGDAKAEDSVDRLSSRPDFMILIYPVITMDAEFTHMGSRENLIGKNPKAELIEHFSNEKQITTHTPPTFIVHSSDDGAVPVKNSLEFYNGLLAKGVEAEMHLYPYGGHGYSLAIDQGGRLTDWPLRCVTWMKELK